MAQQSHKTTFLELETMSSSSSIGTCMICVAENVTLIKMPCCSYEQCETCVSKWKKGTSISCPQCRKVTKTASLAAPKAAPKAARRVAPKAAAPRAASVHKASDVPSGKEDDDVQLALASSMESHEAECKKFETLESQWEQNLEWAISESLSVLSSQTAPHADQEDDVLQEVLKLSELEQSREDVELRAALEESSTLAAASTYANANATEPSPVGTLKRKRVVECVKDDEEKDVDVDVDSSSEHSELKKTADLQTPEFKTPEACYKLIRSGVSSNRVPGFKRPSGVKGKQAMRPSMLLSSGDGDSSLPVDVSLRAALELSMKPQRLFRLEREIERGERSGEAESTCCQGDLSKPCRSTCPFQRNQ